MMYISLPLLCLSMCVYKYILMHGLLQTLEQTATSWDITILTPFK